MALRSRPSLLQNAVRFTAEQDSLNGSVLGPDIKPGSPEFELFITEVHREMTTKAGQKCTAIRRIMVPEAHVQAVNAALVRAAGRDENWPPGAARYADGCFGLFGATRGRA
jgi:oxepin-CoA hydrolase/3-oxo-5,6-dehydrosuberyl-CoA semialdehyde dehydrogenase